MPQASAEPLSISVPAMVTVPVTGSSSTVMFWQATTGAVTSSTVTIAVQLLVLPFTSVAVRVTLLSPTLLQSKMSMSIEMFATPHWSVLPPSTSAATIPALPNSSNCMVMFWQTATGASVSITVMVKLQVLTFPFTSVAVNSMVLTPTGNWLPLGRPAVWTTVSIPQLSMAMVMGKLTVAKQSLASVFAVMFAGQAIVGAMLSSTVTIVVQVETFPFTSVTVKVTVFGPTSAQVKSATSIEVLEIPQASVLPFSISATVMLAFPLASS